MIVFFCFADQYLKMGAATVLLFGLAGMIPAPEEPVLPFNLQTASQSSKVSKNEKEIEDFKVEDLITTAVTTNNLNC